MTDPPHPPTKPTGKPAPPESDGVGRDTYNVVTDTVTGVNIRWKDNALQAIVIGVCLVIGVVLGLILLSDPMLGAGLGAIAGLLVGVLGSGAFLGVYRFVRHLKGRHD